MTSIPPHNFGVGGLQQSDRSGCQAVHRGYNVTLLRQPPRSFDSEPPSPFFSLFGTWAFAMRGYRFSARRADCFRVLSQATVRDSFQHHLRPDYIPACTSRKPSHRTLIARVRPRSSSAGLRTDLAGRQKHLCGSDLRQQASDIALCKRGHVENGNALRPYGWVKRIITFACPHSHSAVAPITLRHRVTLNVLSSPKT